MPSSTVPSETLRKAHAAYDGHDWQRAAELLEQAEAEQALGPEDLRRLAWTRWIGGVIDTFPTLLERSYEGFVAAHDKQGAAIVALDLCRYHANGFRSSVASGWVKRAETLLAGELESAAHGYYELQRAFAAQRDGDIEGGLAHAKRALDLGARFEDINLQALALNRQGRLLVKHGRVAEGRELMDEAMVAAVGGELSMSATGIIYCSTIDGYADVADYGRAADWTQAAQRWCERKSISGFPGICRVHHAEIVRLRGAWGDAEEAAEKAARELEHSAVLHIAAEAHYELGEIRLRRGDLDAAESAFRVANSMGRPPEPGNSLLRLARGRVRAAAGSIRRALEDRTAPLERARLLPAAVEIWLDAGNVDEAASASEELSRIAERFESVVFDALAHAARGMVLLARQDRVGAARELRASVKQWQALGFPYEAARARVCLARAYVADDDLDTAHEEAETACIAFESLGAALDLAAARQLVDETEPAPSTAARVCRTFVFTDIVDSTALVERLGDQAWSRIIRWHDDAIRTIVRRRGGVEIKHTGDGFHLAFDAPAAAVETAVAVQRMLAEHRAETGFAPEVRIGIHQADAFEHGGDFVGVGVHQAARLAALAGGGEILSSAETAEAAAVTAQTSSRRTVQLKGISEPVEAVAIDWTGTAARAGEPTRDAS
jgi:class 3 adenylate cyclase